MVIGMLVSVQIVVAVVQMLVGYYKVLVIVVDLQIIVVRVSKWW